MGSNTWIPHSTKIMRNQLTYGKLGRWSEMIAVLTPLGGDAESEEGTFWCSGSCRADLSGSLWNDSGWMSSLYVGQGKDLIHPVGHSLRREGSTTCVLHHDRWITGLMSCHEVLIVSCITSTVVQRSDMRSDMHGARRITEMMAAWRWYLYQILCYVVTSRLCWRSCQECRWFSPSLGVRRGEVEP